MKLSTFTCLGVSSGLCGRCAAECPSEPYEVLSGPLRESCEPPSDAGAAEGWIALLPP